MGDETYSDFRSYANGLKLGSRTPPASRAKDLPTAKASGNLFEDRGLSALHQSVLDALADGPMTDEMLERLPQFSGLAPSTVRKRRSELAELGYIRRHGVTRNSRGRSMVVWASNHGRYGNAAKQG